VLIIYEKKGRKRKQENSEEINTGLIKYKILMYFSMTCSKWQSLWHCCCKPSFCL